MKAKKFRKFDEGGPADEMDMEAPPAKSAPIQDISFKEAFRSAKDAGLKTFNFGGKKYTTETASPKMAASAQPKPSVSILTASPASSGSDNTSGVPQPGRYSQETYETPLKAAMRKYGPDVMDAVGKIVQGMGPMGAEAYMGGSKLINAMRGLGGETKAAKLAAGNANNADRMARIVKDAQAAVDSDAAKREMFKAAQKGKDYAQATEDRLTGLAMNPRRANIPVKPSEAGKPIPPSKARARTSFDEDQSEVEFRKGGKIKKYAKGGMVSSASKRGDGCAQRGKTKGKYC